MLVDIGRAWDENRELTDEASSAREMVCCARVMFAIGGASCCETQWFGRGGGKLSKKCLNCLKIHV